jgi:hypothetical protein
MKRELDLIRAILLQLEQDIDWKGKLYAFGLGDDQKIVVEGYTDEQVYCHLLMLLESPFVEGRRFLSGEIEVKSITWDGREFLDSIRDPGSWGKVKDAAEKVGGVGLGFMWDIAKVVIRGELKTKLGLDI